MSRQPEHEAQTPTPRDARLAVTPDAARRQAEASPASLLSHWGVFEAASRISDRHCEGEDDESVDQWRRVVLRLADTIAASAISHPHLAPMLREAMDNALEQLLLYGREDDLLALDDWLAMEAN